VFGYTCVGYSLAPPARASDNSIRVRPNKRFSSAPRLRIQHGYVRLEILWQQQALARRSSITLKLALTGQVATTASVFVSITDSV